MSFFGDVLEGLGNMAGVASSDKWANKNLDLQRDAAKNSIQWRVADAKKAGIHPLYALGNPGISISPVSNDAPAYMSAVGQNISRAVTAGLTAGERKREAAQAALRAGVQFDQETTRRDLENQLLRAEIAKLDRSQVGPPAPTVNPPGAAVGAVEPRPSQPIVGSVGEPSRQPGAITDYQYYRRGDGGIGVTYSDEMKQRSEDDLAEQFRWQWNNRIVPFISGSNRGPGPGPTTRDYPLPGRQMWRWDRRRQAYFPYNPATNRWVN